MTINRVLLVIAIICFVLAAFGLGIAGVSIGWLGLAFMAGAQIA